MGLDFFSTTAARAAENKNSAPSKNLSRSGRDTQRVRPDSGWDSLACLRRVLAYNDKLFLAEHQMVRRLPSKAIAVRFHFVAPVQCTSAVRSDLPATEFIASFTSWAYRIAKLLINSGLRS